MKPDLSLDLTLIAALLGTTVVGLGWAVSEWRSRMGGRRRKVACVSSAQTTLKIKS